MNANIEPVSSATSASDLPTAQHPSIPQAWVLDGELLVRPGAAGDDATPIRVGFLSDMPSGSGVVGFLDPIMLAFEDAMREGRLRRPVEILATHALGLPAGEAENVIAAYRDLVDQGCAIVLSTGVTNNALVLRDVINESHVPYITMAGTTRFVGEYCFSLANGGHGEEAAILAAFLAEQGYRRVVLTGEGTEGDAEYRAFSRSRRRSMASRSSTRTTSTAHRATTRSTRCWSASAHWSPTRWPIADSGSTANSSAMR